MTEQLFTKKGRRYIPWGNLDLWDSQYDLMQINSFRLIHCPAPGHYRIRHEVQPDRAGFIAAALEAELAMEQALTERAKAHPALQTQPYTEEQQQIIKKFRDDMIATGALVPMYWNNSTASEIAKAGIDAVIKSHLKE